MHHHDIEIIMALVEGALDPESAAAARVEVAACDECSLDLEMQTSVLASLQELPEASLTEMESARLRRNVRDELGIVAATPIAATQQKRRRMPLAALATAAAVLVAVVVVGPGLDLIGGGGDSTDDTIIALPTTAAATAELDQAPNAGDMQVAEGAEAPETTFAAAVTTTVPPPPAMTAPPTTTRTGAVNPTLYAFFAQAADLGTVFEAVFATEFDEQASRSSVLKLSGDSIQEEQLDDSQVCTSITISSDDNLIEGFQVARGLIDGREVLYIAYLAEDLEESVLVAHAADNCEELGRASL